MDTALQAGWGAHVRQFSNICFISALNCSTSVYSDCQTTATSVKCRTKMRTQNKKQNKKQRGLAHLDLVGNLADVHRGRDDRVIVRIDLRIHGLRKDVGVLLVSYLRSHPINNQCDVVEGLGESERAPRPESPRAAHRCHQAASSLTSFSCPAGLLALAPAASSALAPPRRPAPPACLLRLPRTKSE